MLYVRCIFFGCWGGEEPRRTRRTALRYLGVQGMILVCIVCQKWFVDVRNQAREPV